MDVADVSWGKFFDERKTNLWERFPGSYRARVVEVNDPLGLNRIRFICPEMHDSDMKAEECPWATAASSLGGKKSGSIATPCIGDWVWISFEKQHPYGPVWYGYATPTKKKYYVPGFLAEKPEPPLNAPPTSYKDYDEDYFPKDGRPLIYGYQDRYGNVDISSSIGYYPIEHDVLPPPPDVDPINKNIVGSDLKKPVANSPDKKFMLRASKYGNILLLGDQGYYWKKEGEYGEFYGDQDKDDKFEAARFLYIQKLINENIPDTTLPDTDQRRIGLLSRYGHKFEMRDTGWAQPGPVSSKSRKDEYGDPAYLSKETKRDFRWIKIRTKGGMLFQAYDKGTDPDADTYVKRTNLDEVGANSEKEDEYWSDRDARWMRLVSRHGYKFVIDDRGSDPKKSEELEQPSGNGVLIKGRKSPSSHNESKTGNPKGFYWEFNENEELNHSSWGSPNGQSVEINDRYQYMMVSSGLGSKWAADHQGIKENEFIGKPVMNANPELTTHHLKIDLDNEYVRLKTRANKGDGAIDPAVQSGVSAEELNQGFEARDGDSDDGPWVEIVDSQNRGFWFSKKYQVGVWRASNSSNMYQVMDDTSKKVVIHNNETTGVIEIYSASAINIIASTISLQAENDINIKAGGAINMQSSGTRVSVQDAIRTVGDIYLRQAFIVPSANNVPSVTRTIGYSNIAGAGTTPLVPTDRAKTYNGPFDAPDRQVIEHKILT